MKLLTALAARRVLVIRIATHLLAPCDAQVLARAIIAFGKLSKNYQKFAARFAIMRQLLVASDAGGQLTKSERGTWSGPGYDTAAKQIHFRTAASCQSQSSVQMQMDNSSCLTGLFEALNNRKWLSSVPSAEADNVYCPRSRSDRQRRGRLNV